MLKSRLIKNSCMALCCIFLLSQPLSARDNCAFKNFNIKISESVTIGDLVDELGNMCHFSTVTKDVEAQKLLKNVLNGVNIKDMALHEVFDLILKENNINYQYKNKVLKISSLQTKTFKIDYITSVRKGTANLSASVDVEPVENGDKQASAAAGDNEIKVEEQFNFWQTLDAELKALLNNGTETYTANDPIINQNTGLITITATSSQLNRVEHYIEELKKRLHKQVLIDVSIIAVELSNNYTTGINWSKFQFSINSQQDSDGNRVSDTGTGLTDTFVNTLHDSARSLNIVNKLHFSMEGLMNFIKTKGNSKVISNPKVMTLNNQQALITIGDNINYRVQEDSTNDESGNTSVTYTPYSVFIGVLLNILPEVSDDNKIMLRINPSLSNFKYTEDDAKQTSIREIAPDTLEKKLSTVVQVNSGDTIILGGLIGQTKGKSKTSVPLLGDLPVVGSAFRSTSDATSTSELVFVITPHIINPDKPQKIGTSLKDLGFSESLYE